MLELLEASIVIAAMLEYKAKVNDDISTCTVISNYRVTLELYVLYLISKAILAVPAIGRMSDVSW